jgi:glutamyl-tRNA synthetase
LALEQERVVTLAEFGEKCAFFFVEEVSFDDVAVQKWFGQAHVPKLFSDLTRWLTGASSAAAEECESFLRAWAQENGFEKLGPAVHPTRVALTGATAGPGLFELMELLGPERMIRRLKKAAERLW